MSPSAKSSEPNGKAQLRFDFTNAMADTVGPEHGVEQGELDGLTKRLAEGHAALEQLRSAGEVAFYDLPYMHETIARVKGVAKLTRKRKFKAVVVLGIGGSALGAIALRTALCPPPSEGFPRLYVEDNIDPDALRALLDTIEPAKTLFIVISKSGSTVETMSQLLLVRSVLHGDMTNNVVAITDREKGALRRVADEECLDSLEVPKGVGGRFSVLSPVGLLPAAVCGIDIDGLLAGAAAADSARCASASPDENDAYMAAAVEYLLYQKGHHLSVMMPYSSALADVADWYRQLWAESLGKSSTVGPTPIRAVGVTDQHSQLQLYLDGPNDKVLCFLAVGQFRNELQIPPAWRDREALGYISGHTFNQLMDYERIATTLALTDASRPNYTITLPRITPYAIGQLFYMLEVKAAISGQLYGVDAFNQPGVEAVKVLIYRQMGRPGY